MYQKGLRVLNFIRKPCDLKGRELCCVQGFTVALYDLNLYFV